MHNKLPLRVTLLLWLVLILTAWNVLRLWTSIAWHNVLVEYSAQPGPILVDLAAAIWVAVGFAVIWGIWRNKPWTAKLLLWATTGYTIWYWAERLIWQAPRPNWPFAVILNLLALILIIFATRSLAREAYDRKPPTQKAE
jgi:hypothetical protein